MGSAVLLRANYEVQYLFLYRLVWIGGFGQWRLLHMEVVFHMVVSDKDQCRFGSVDERYYTSDITKSTVMQ